MIRQTIAARRQIDALTDHYIEKRRYDAALNLERAVREAIREIEADPHGGRQHPRPYPALARWGFRWLKIHRYWVGWSIAKGFPVLTNVLHDTSNMSIRIAPDDADDIPL